MPGALDATSALQRNDLRQTLLLCRSDPPFHLIRSKERNRSESPTFSTLCEDLWQLAVLIARQMRGSDVAIQRSICQSIEYPSPDMHLRHWKSALP
jgi:hypothetical protein